MAVEEVIEMQGLSLDPSSHRVMANEQALDMGPTEFDAMEDKSHQFYPDLPVNVQRNRLLLLGIMLGAGFQAIPTEWWHFELPNADDYPLLHE